MNVPAAELTTVGPDEAVIHKGSDVRRYTDLLPDSEQRIDGFAFRTLPEPGPRLATFATVNDVHFGEQVCGVVEGSDVGPTFRSEPGEEPYPEMMNRAAIAEIAALDPDVVVVKGDLTSTGARAQYHAFLSAYEGTFGDRLFHVRGNHESFDPPDGELAAFPTQEIVLPGVRIALLDTALAGKAGGGVSGDQLEWLDTLAAGSDLPVLVLGHHHVWNPASPKRSDEYFGIRPDDSERLIALVARRPSIIGYFAGHTHRNRVRRFAETGDVPWVEVACVKDFPGAWAEYRVHEGGIVQVFRRISAPEALAWTDKTRVMYEGLYAEYAFGTLADRCFVISPRT